MRRIHRSAMALLSVWLLCAACVTESSGGPSDGTSDDAGQTETDTTTSGTDTSTEDTGTPETDSSTEDTGEPEDDTTTDPDAPEPAVLSALELTANVATLQVGRAAVVSVVARDQNNEPMEAPAGLTWMSSNTDVLVIEGSIARALAEGTAEVSVRLDAVESNRVAFTVIPGVDNGENQLHVLPEQVVLAAGQEQAMTLEARDGSGLRLDTTEALWQSSNMDVVTVDEQGIATAVAEGSAQVWATLGMAESPRRDIQVTAAETWLAVELISPDGDGTVRDTLEVHVMPEWRVTGSPSLVGEPVSPDRAEVLINGSSYGELTPDLLGASGVIDVTQAPLGPLEMMVRVEVGGTVALSRTISLTRLAAPTPMVWDDLGSVDAPVWETVHGRSGRMWFVGEDLYVASTLCGRECTIGVWRWNPGEERWNSLEYQQFHVRDLNGIEERVVERNNVDLPRYVGWGWISTNARDAHTLRQLPRPMIAWSNQEARTSFNVEGNPERYWNDCYAAEWEPTAGWDGQGGWRIYTEDNPAYHDSPPHPNDLPEEVNEQQFPAGADAIRTEDCNTPKLALEPNGNVLMAFVSAPIPGSNWQLRLRRWNGTRWSDAGEPLALDQVGAALRAMTQDASGNLVAAVDRAEGPGRVVRFVDGGWQPMDNAPRADALQPLEGGGVVAASIEGGDAAVWTSSQDAWVRLGNILDANPWAEVHAIDLVAADGVLAVAWAEGPPLGNWDIHVAVWRSNEARWERLGDGPVDIDLDRSALDPHIALDPQGRLLVQFSVPNDPDADMAGGSRAYIQRVRRTRTSILAP